MLEEILTKCEFKEDGLYLGNSGLQPLKVYQFLHEAVADSHLPVFKVCGFNLSSASKTGFGNSVTERNVNVLENTFEIAYNLTDKIFICPNSSVVSTVDFDGVMDLEPKNDILMANAKYPEILYTNAHILTSVRPVTLKLKIMCGTGYWAMGDTYKHLQDTSYFPMAVKFSIHDMCRVCPPMYEDRVEYRMHKLFKPEHLKYHLTLLYSKKEELSKEDKQWLLSYEQ